METVTIELTAIDDSQEHSGEVIRDGISVNLEKSGDLIGFRFELPGEDKPAAARLELYLPQDGLSTVRASIHCEAAGVSQPFSGKDFDLGSRQLTAAKVDWNANDLGRGVATSPDCLEPLLSVLERSDRVPGMAVAFILVATTDAASFRVSALEKGDAFRARLLLDYEQPEKPPLPTAYEGSIIVRDIPDDRPHEVRLVRPGDIVMGPGGIDWEQTPYVGYVFTANADRENDVPPTD